MATCQIIFTTRIKNLWRAQVWPLAAATALLAIGCGDEGLTSLDEPLDDAAAVAAHLRASLLSSPPPAGSDDGYVGVDAYLYPNQLRPGDVVQSFDHKLVVSISEQSWLAYLDDGPDQRFTHDVRFAVVRAVDGHVELYRANWWPMVNGEQSAWGADLSRLGKPFYSHRPDGLQVVQHRGPGGPQAPPLSQPPSALLPDPPNPPKPRPRVTRYAVIIGGMDNAATKADINKVSTFFRSTNVGVLPGNLTTIKYNDAAKGTVKQKTAAVVQQIETAMADLKKKAGPNDEVLIYYSGHGLDGQWAIGNDDKTGTNYEATRLAGQINGFQSDRVMVLNDACHSESIGTRIQQEVDSNNENLQNLHDKEIYVSYSCKTKETAGFSSSGGWYTTGVIKELSTASVNNPGYWAWSRLGFQVDRASWQIWTVTRALGLYTQRTQHGGMLHIMPNRCDDKNPCTKDRWNSATRTCEHEDAMEGARCYYANGSFPFSVASCRAGKCTPYRSCLLGNSAALASKKAGQPKNLFATGKLPSGVYWIDPDGAGGKAPLRAYCDLSTGGGGWTVVDPKRSAAWGGHFASWRVTAGGMAGPTGGDSASCSSWRKWFNHGAGLAFRVSPGCGMVAASGEVYRMTGNYYGCKWYNRNCDMGPGGGCKTCKDNWHPNAPTKGTCTHLISTADLTYCHKCSYDWWNTAPAVGTTGSYCVAYR